MSPAEALAALRECVEHANDMGVRAFNNACCAVLLDVVEASVEFSDTWSAFIEEDWDELPTEAVGKLRAALTALGEAVVS